MNISRLLEEGAGGSGGLPTPVPLGERCKPLFIEVGKALRGIRRMQKPVIHPSPPSKEGVLVAMRALKHNVEAA